MPEPTGLDDRLAAGRTRLLATIDQPPLARIGRRAATLRRRRRAAVAAGALVAVLATGVPATEPWWGPSPTPPPVADTLPAGGPIYTGAGITINGLVDIKSVTDLPGTIADVAFIDADHGYLVTACDRATDCRPTFASTTDGGLTWRHRPAPMARDASPDLITFPDGSVALVTGRAGIVSSDGGQTWTETPGSATTSAQRAGRDEVLRAFGDQAGCVGGRVDVWSRQHGFRGTLVNQPGMGVCRVSPAAGADGVWWVGGTAGSQAAVATTRDGGQHWEQHVLPGMGAARVTTMGSHAYAVVTGVGKDDLREIYHSIAGGPFVAVPDRGGRPAEVAGEPIALLDGRLVIAAGGRWYVSSDDGASFTLAEGNLPWVGRLARTATGYVAYNLFNQGWAAFSADGATWRKFPVR